MSMRADGHRDRWLSTLLVNSHSHAVIPSVLHKCAARAQKHSATQVAVAADRYRFSRRREVVARTSYDSGADVTKSVVIDGSGAELVPYLPLAPTTKTAWFR